MATKQKNTWTNSSGTVHHALILDYYTSGRTVYAKVNYYCGYYASVSAAAKSAEGSLKIGSTSFAGHVAVSKSANTTAKTMAYAPYSTSGGYASVAYGAGAATTVTISYSEYAINSSKSWVAFTDSVSVSIPATTYTVAYNANGGSGAPSSQTKTYGTNLTLSSTKPTRASTSSNPTGTITVSYNANGGSGAPSASTGTYTDTKTTTYTFNGWNTNSSGTGTNYSAGGTYSANAAATLYAKWTSNTSTTRKSNPSITLSGTKPTRTGYNFLGWSTSSTATTASYKPSTAYTFSANTTLYAVWQKITYTVSYNANNGTGAPANQTKTYGENLTLSSTVPTRTGYKFVHWNTSSDDSGTVYSPGGTYTTNAALTLYAIWAVPTACYCGVDNVARSVNSIYYGVDGVAHRVVKVYVGVDGKAKLCYEYTG